MTMKRYGILILTLLFLFSCVEKKQENIFTIEGDTGTPKGMVYLYGTDSRYDKADSIACDESGYFRISIPADTITPLTLVTPDRRTVPVYGEPMLTARLKRDSTLRSGWCVDGGETQALHDSISRVLDACDKTKELHEKIDTFILKRDFGIPVCSIEKEYINSASGQLRTRFQAFVESIEIKQIQEGN